MKLASSAVNGKVNTKASMIAASYYPDWVSSTNPPEGIDFSKFDILYFGQLFLRGFLSSSPTVASSISFCDTELFLDRLFRFW